MVMDNGQPGQQWPRKLARVHAVYTRTYAKGVKVCMESVLHIPPTYMPCVRQMQRDVEDLSNKLRYSEVGEIGAQYGPGANV